jgi:hypothetical protein
MSKIIVGDTELLSLHQSFCLDAARDMIRHIAALFQLAPHLRAWSYYCFYCLQATLVILPKLASEDHIARNSPHSIDATNKKLQSTDRPENDWEVCNHAVRVFEQIELKASQRCAEVVKQYLIKWKRVKPAGSPRPMASKRSPLHETEPLWKRTKLRADSMKSTDSISSLKDPRTGSTRGAQGLQKIHGTSRIAGPDPGSVARTSPSSLSELRGELYGAFYSQNGPGIPDFVGHGHSFNEDYSFIGNLPPDTGTDWDWASIMGFEGGSI